MARTIKYKALEEANKQATKMMSLRKKKAKAKKKKKLIIVEMTQYQAEALGIVYCSCGHPPNNHFSSDKRPCARCDCKKYDQQISLPRKGK